MLDFSFRLLAGSRRAAAASAFKGALTRLPVSATLVRLPALAIAVSLAGCSGSNSKFTKGMDAFLGDSSSQLARQLTAFQGRPVDEMIAKLGEPAEQRETDGQRVLTWRAEQRSFSEGYWMGFENDSSYKARCVVTAQVHDQTVVKVDHEGNMEDCRYLGL